MKIFHSFWTKPNKHHLLDILWFYGLSLAYLKRLGVDVNLHTDSKGEQLLKNLPYSNIYLTLNNIPEDFPSICWAGGKFFAAQAEELGNIHIDGDVFIKKEECLNRFYTDKDVLVQSTEDSFGRNPEMDHITNIFKNIGIDVRCPRSCGLNCGVIGFNNQELKEKYIKGYFDNVQKLKTYLTSEAPINFCTPDLVLEQRYLFELTKDNYSYQCVCEGFNYDDINNNAKKLGYLHLLTNRKYNHTEQIKEWLKKLNPDIYNQIQENITNYNNEI